MPTLPGPGFVEAVNSRGGKQVIPAAWLEDGHPFAGQFRLTRRAEKRSQTPPARAASNTTKAGKASATDSAQRGAEED